MACPNVRAPGELEAVRWKLMSRHTVPTRSTAKKIVSALAAENGNFTRGPLSGN
jgi:hypothetical protein